MPLSLTAVTRHGHLSEWILPGEAGQSLLLTRSCFIGACRENHSSPALVPNVFTQGVCVYNWKVSASTITRAPPDRLLGLCLPSVHVVILGELRYSDEDTDTHTDGRNLIGHRVDYVSHGPLLRALWNRSGRLGSDWARVGRRGTQVFARAF